MLRKEYKRKRKQNCDKKITSENSIHSYTNFDYSGRIQSAFFGEVVRANSYMYYVSDSLHNVEKIPSFVFFITLDF